MELSTPDTDIGSLGTSAKSDAADVTFEAAEVVEQLERLDDHCGSLA